MAWSSFAHLPNNEEEYLKILMHLKNNMNINDVDRAIATIKKKEKIPYHYRSNLERIGLFKIEKGNILLNYDREKLIENSSLLKEILKKVVIENNSNEINEIIIAIFDNYVLPMKNYYFGSNLAIEDILKNPSSYKYPLSTILLISHLHNLEINNFLNIKNPFFRKENACAL